LELIVRVSPTIGESYLTTFYRDTNGWFGPFSIKADGASIKGLTGF
jgi:hypothetical protein